MRRLGPYLALAIAAAGMVLSLIGCPGGEPAPSPSPSPTPTAVPTPTPSPTPCVLSGEPTTGIEVPNTLGDWVNRAMLELRPDCSVGGTCVLGDTTQQQWQAAVEAKLRDLGLCAGQHGPGTDEIAVAVLATDPWQGFHVFVGDDSDGPRPPGGARRTVQWSPRAYRGAWLPPRVER